MSDYSDSEDSDYVSYDERKEILEAAIDGAETDLKSNILNVWEFISSTVALDDFDPKLGVILALKDFCKEPTNSAYEEKLIEDIVDLVGSSVETQYRLEDFVAAKFRNSLFWTSLIATLKVRYEEEEQRKRKARRRKRKAEKRERKLRKALESSTLLRL